MLRHILGRYDAMFYMRETGNPAYVVKEEL